MRSKIAVWGYLIILSLGTMLSLYMPKTEAAAKESIVIPGEAIRLRILANSDFESDQAIKRKVRDAVNAQITLWVQDLTTMEKARAVINEKLPEIQAIAERVVSEQGSDQSVKVKFGKVQFPTKLYGQFLYPAGEYQAILITLGKGEGANWWCVLYPPLCFLDFSNGVAVSDGFEEEHKAKAEMVNEKEHKAKAEMVNEKEHKAKAEMVNEKEVADAKVAVVTEKKIVANRETVVNQVKEEKAVKVEGEVKYNKISSEKRIQSLNEDEVEQPKKQAVLVNQKEEEVNKPTTQIELADKEVVKKQKKHAKKDAPVYTADDEQPVKVKFFVVEMWEKLFD